jgi:Domain of unknown function (DUF5615)
MSQVRFLIDESVRLSVVAALHRLEPAIDVHRVGQPGMPAFASSDSDLLAFGESSQRILVSLDRASMPGEIANHLANGRHTWGVLFVTRRCSFRQLLDDLVLIWSASDAEEWRDTIHYLPIS